MSLSLYYGCFGLLALLFSVFSVSVVIYNACLCCLKSIPKDPDHLRCSESGWVEENKILRDSVSFKNTLISSKQTYSLHFNATRRAYPEKYHKVAQVAAAGSKSLFRCHFPHRAGAKMTADGIRHTANLKLGLQLGSFLPTSGPTDNGTLQMPRRKERRTTVDR